MIRTRASVKRRAGQEHPPTPGTEDFFEIPLDQLVPGDIVRLSAGDVIPGDLRLLTARDVFVNQSALTGESMPVEKHAEPQHGVARDPFEFANICFMGSSVVSGFATGVIVHTGRQTYFGRLAASIVGARELTSFDKGISRFAWLMIRFILVMAPLVFLINGLTKGDWLEALLFAVAVAVGLTPEMLPMIVTVNLRAGRDRDVPAQGHRQAPKRHPEFWRDGCAVHRQDRHAHAGPRHHETSPRCRGQ